MDLPDDDRAPDERFEIALRDLTDLHATASRLRGLEAAAERTFATGLRIGDQVRRAVRQRRSDRPNEHDCAVVETAIAELRAPLDDTLSSGPVRDLRAAIAAGDPVAAAERAIEVFARIAAAHPPPRFGFRSISLRRRRRREGEALRAPEEVAVEIASLSDTGLAAEDSDPGSGSDGLPEAIALAPSLESCDSEVAIRFDIGAGGLPVFRHLDSGAIWIFAAKLTASASAVAAGDPDDEWWAASPIPYRRYVERLSQALEERGVAMDLRAGAGPP